MLRHLPSKPAWHPASASAQYHLVPSTILVLSIQKHVELAQDHKREPGKAMEATNAFTSLTMLQLGLDDPSLFVQHGIIGGKHVDAQDGKTFSVDSK